MSDELTDIAIEDLRRLSDILEHEEDGADYNLCLQCGNVTENEEFCSMSCARLFEMDEADLRTITMEAELDFIHESEYDSLNDY